MRAGSQEVNGAALRTLSRRGPQVRILSRAVRSEATNEQAGFEPWKSQPGTAERSEAVARTVFLWFESGPAHSEARTE